MLRVELRTIPMRLRRICPFRLLGVPVGSGIALSAVLATSNPAAFRPCPGCVETSGNVIKQPLPTSEKFVEPYLNRIFVGRHLTCILPSLLFLILRHSSGNFRHVSFPLAFLRRGSCFFPAKATLSAIIGPDNEPFFIMTCIDPKEESVPNLSRRLLLFAVQLHLAQLAR